ncbi:hypothetical protein EON77_18350 [bacterium]|nr:MAG: hypothetical protein EON77_18350 [bacterium]
MTAFRYQSSYAPPGDPEFAVRTRPGGYDVEARIPWETLYDGPRTASAGRGIALSIALDMRDDPAARGREAFSLLENLPLPDGVATSCATGVALPSCDDRLWCTPTLE